MGKKLIFETKQFWVRKLQMNDLEPFHEMHANINVMRYVRGTAMTREENEKELPELIEKYDLKDNDFWIYAIERKQDGKFVGTVALVKDDQNDDELGYRFLEKYWGNGYGYEICQGLIDYCRAVGFPKLVGYVADVNIASAKILKRCNFSEVSKGVEPNLQIPETKYEIIL